MLMFFIGLGVGLLPLCALFIMAYIKIKKGGLK